MRKLINPISTIGRKELCSAINWAKHRLDKTEVSSLNPAELSILTSPFSNFAAALKIVTVEVTIAQ